jgi:dTDP-4-amino-4,6-dideoxygalactose transaminase
LRSISLDNDHDFGGCASAPEDAERLPATAFPFVDLKAQYASLRDDIVRAVTRVLESQQFILGAEVEAFEREIAARTGAREAVSCASGTAALELSIGALDIGPGDEVITTPFTFVATAGAIVRAGARPVFVDIERDTFNLNPKLLEAAASPRTRAVIPVHLFGLPARMDAILQFARKRGIAVVEDAAQSIGAQVRGRLVGGLGDLGCFSFFPSKNLGGAGDGGLIATSRADLAERLRLMRVHGSRGQYQYEIQGTNSRLDAMQAAILRVKLGHLARWTRERQARAAQYRELFAYAHLEEQLRLPIVPDGCTHVFNQYVIRCPERDRLREFLTRGGIPTQIYYPTPLHLQPAFADLKYRPGQFPEAEAASREVLALPVYPEISADRQAAVVEAIGRFYGRHGGG